MNSIKSSEYNSADNYDYPEFIAVSGKDDRTPDEGFDNLEEAKVRADKIGGFVYQMINGEGVEIYSANESTTETTESEKATEIKEEYSEYAYKEYLNGMLDENGELLVFGRHFRGADDLEENDNPAFREGYNQWLDDLEREGTNTGVNESIANEDSDMDHDQDSDFKYHGWEDDHEEIEPTVRCGICGATMLKSEYADKKLAGESKTSESYWGDQGQYQDLYNKYHSEIPDEGSVNDSLLEQLRIVSNVYYEVGNNGGGNMISGMGSAGEHGKINATIPETTWLVNRTEQTENSGGLEYEEEQELIRASLQELDGVVDNLLQQIKNDRADKDEQSNYWGESGQVEPDENWNVGRWTSGKGLNEDMYADDDVKLDTEAEIDNYIKEGTDPAPYEEEDMPESIKSELKDEGKERSKSDIQAMKDLGAGDFAGDIPDDMSVDQWLGGDDNEDKDEAEEIIGAMGMADDLMDTYGSSPNADPTTTPLEDHSGTDDSSDTQTDTVDAQQETSDISGDTVEESFGDCGCKDTNKARTTWESAKEGDKQYWLRNMGEDEGYSYYHFEHLPKRVGESLVNKFKVEESEDRGWSKIPALERANLLKKLGFPPRDAELVANLEYPQLSESLKKDVNDAVGVKKKAEESKREKPDGQLAFENDLYSNMYDGYLQRRGQRVDSKKNNKF